MEREKPHGCAGREGTMGRYCPYWPFQGLRQGVQKKRCEKWERASLSLLDENFTEHLLFVRLHDATILHVALHAAPCPWLPHWCQVLPAAFLSNLGFRDTDCMSPGVSSF